MSTILLIDDDVAGVNVREQLLRVSGYDVLVAYTGERGMTLAESRAVDLVVLDLNLPDGPGEDVLWAIHEVKPDLPVVVLSGVMDVPVEVVKLAAAVLVKGDGAQRLLDCIEEQIGKRKR